MRSAAGRSATNSHTPDTMSSLSTADWACLAIAVFAALLLARSLWTLLSSRSPSAAPEDDPPHGPLAPQTVRS